MIKIINDEVYRPRERWTEQVHKFLNFLHQQGFTNVPKPIRIEKDFEVVSYVPGKTYDDLLLKSKVCLISSAKLLRAYHDTSQNFLNENDTLLENWMFPSSYPQEVICHNDFAPYNICFQDDEAIGIIDFDTAHPGPRIWDIAYALYRFSPFTNFEDDKKFGDIDSQIRRASLFCKVYGLDIKDRFQLVDTMIERLNVLHNFLLESAHQGHKKYQLNIKEGHDVQYLNDIEYIDSHKNIIQDAFTKKFISD
ncbi:MAG: phosphotransferase enzyme family protein [Janthinobacterium lividum]